MPKIVITEYDLTTPGTNAESNEVVYIPGCVDTAQDELWKLERDDGKTYIGLEANQPTLFRSVSEFESLCGSRGLKFESDQDYRSLVSKDAKGNITTAFDANAISYDSKMFIAGTVDPAYVMAKELLAAGLNVMYERINKGEQYIEIDSDTTLDFKSNYAKYYTRLPIIAPIRDGKAPSDFRTRKFFKWLKSATSIDTESSYVLVPSNQILPGTDDIYHSVITGDKYDSILEYYLVTQKDILDEEGNITGSTQTLYTKLEGEALDALLEEVAAEGATPAYKKFVNLGTQVVEWKEVVASTELHTYTVTPCGSTVVDNISYTCIETPAFEAVASNNLPTDWATTYFDFDKYFELLPATDSSDGTYKATYVPVPNSELDLTVFKQQSGVQLEEVYEALNNVYAPPSDYSDGLFDKGNYNIKYITSGGYPVYEYGNGSIMTKMLNLAATRGDCYALIDHTDNKGREPNISKEGSLYKKLKEQEITNGDYGAMFTPWATYSRTTTDSDKDAPDEMRMPASYAYLQALAHSLKTNAPWLAVAGAARGGIRYLADGGMTTIISNGVADAMQPRQYTSVNAITNIKPYGQTIWGNRTLKYNEENLVATSFLNIRNLLCDVKKEAYSTARALTFEQDSEVLWINFKSRIAKLLDRMLSGYGISGYKILRDTERKEAREKATVCAKIILYPTYAVEDFYIDIVLRDGDVTVESNV